VLDEHDLWKRLAFVSMYSASRAVVASSSLIGRDAYSMVVSILTEISELDRTIATGMNACNYIRERTGLSRSVVMKYLGELSRRGFITINRGVLVEITNIPDNL